MENYKNIKKFESACKLTKHDPKKLPVVTGTPKEHQKAIIAHYKLRIIAQAINLLDNGKSWKPDFNNSDEWKYWPYFKKTGAGFSGSLYGDWRAYAFVGSRLCYRDSDRAQFAATQFKSLYNDIIKY